MRFFIFNYENNSNLIDSFLSSACRAHGYDEPLSRGWFIWKFRDNPYGPTILTCAEEDGVIVGCVGYGFQPFILNGKTLNGVMSFETFVHPDYQRRGIFSKLIKLAEIQLVEQKVDFILNFPNSNSLKGFLNSGWKQNPAPEYRIKFNNIINSMIHINDFRSEFISKYKNNREIYGFNNFDQVNNDYFYLKLNKEFINWRFFSYPLHEYYKIEKDSYQAVVKVGYRGKIKEGHILFINISDNKTFSMNDLIKECKNIKDLDVLSLSVSKVNGLRSQILRHGFVRVPSKVRMCYKILNNLNIRDSDISNLSFEGIYHHTN
ncbi:MAG TPA: GNAT family N-acetyltransferase [Bacteroidales bacterium]|nr:GNAT family N-acetyltransferase [Bacteroidales bacterium]